MRKHITHPLINEIRIREEFKWLPDTYYYNEYINGLSREHEIRIWLETVYLVEWYGGSDWYIGMRLYSEWKNYQEKDKIISMFNSTSMTDRNLAANVLNSEKLIISTDSDFYRRFLHEDK